MADRLMIMADVLTRGLRKLKQLSHPAPVNIIFSQLGNSGFRKKITADRHWQFMILDSLSDFGAVIKHDHDGRTTYKMGDPEKLAFVLSEFAEPTPSKIQAILGLKKSPSSERKTDSGPIYIDPAWFPRSKMPVSEKPEIDFDPRRPIDMKVDPAVIGKSALPVLFTQIRDSMPDSTKELKDPDEDEVIENIVKPYAEMSESRRRIVERVAPRPDVEDVTPDVIPQEQKVDVKPTYGENKYTTNFHEMSVEEELPKKPDPLPVSAVTAPELPPPPPPSAPVYPKPKKAIASEHPALTDLERQRIQLIEDVLLRLADDEWYPRTDLFPGEYSEGDIRWQRISLQILSEAGVLQRQGERRNTKYHGVTDQVYALLDDPEWLLRLLVPDINSRSEEVVIVDDDSDDAEFSESDELSPATEASPSVTPSSDVLEEVAKIELISEVQRLFPGFYKILESQHERITQLEGDLSAANSKLDEVLSLLKAKK